MANLDTAFTGAVPELYTRHLGQTLFEPYARQVAGRIAPLAPGRLLETACGTGIVTRALGRALPDTAAITATDLNPAMLDHARTIDGGERIRWQQADAQALPFADAAFDAVVCGFGVMFFPDKPRAHAEVWRVLRPGGSFVFTLWDSIETNELQFLVHNAVAALYPQDPPGFLRRTPCGYHDLATIRADLAQAGFLEPTIETLELPSIAATARDPAIGFVRGSPLGGETTARDPDGLEPAVAAATAAIAARFGSGPVEARMQALLVTAQRPAA